MFETPLRAVHERAGATLGTYLGCVLPERFTDFSSEYRHARDGVALLDTNWHALASFQGPDRLRYLNAVLSNNIAALKEGQGCLALLLNPQGHVLAELECYALADQIYVRSAAEVRERTHATLERFIIMDDVTLVDRSMEDGSIALEGPRAGEVIAKLCGAPAGYASVGEMPEFATAAVSINTHHCRLIRRSHFGSNGFELLSPRAALPALWQGLRDAAQACGGGPVGYAALEALRIQAGVKCFGPDFDDSVIPQEAGLETTHISFSKGCYTGQEIVERVRSRGHVNRRLVGLEFDTRTAPAHGATLAADGKEVGQVTSSAFSPALARVIGLGYVRREHNAPGSVLECMGEPARVVTLPFEPGRR
jgi:folate-binding protein YgfZ